MPSESAVVGLRRFVTFLSRLQGSHEALYSDSGSENSLMRASRSSW